MTGSRLSLEPIFLNSFKTEVRVSPRQSLELEITDSRLSLGSIFLSVLKLKQE
jgi:hypothetical protein